MSALTLISACVASLGLQVQQADGYAEVRFTGDAAHTIEWHHQPRRVVGFIAGANVTPAAERFTSGPLRAARLEQRARGAVIVLAMRGRPRQWRPQLTLPESTASVATVGLKTAQKPDRTPLALKKPAPPSADPAPSEPTHTNVAPQALPTNVIAKNAKRAALLDMGLAGPGMLIFASVCGLVFVAFRRKKPQGDSAIAIESTQALGGRQRVAVVRAGEERFLVAATDKEIQLLSPLRDRGTPTFEEALEERLEEPAPDDAAGLLRVRNHRRLSRVLGTIPADGGAA